MPAFELEVGRLDIDSWAIHKNLYHPIFQVIDQDGWTRHFSRLVAGKGRRVGKAGIVQRVEQRERAGQLLVGDSAITRPSAPAT
jgi:hypothetical protein